MPGRPRFRLCAALYTLTNRLGESVGARSDEVQIEAGAESVERRLPLAITRPSHLILRTRSNCWSLYQTRAQIALRAGRFSDMFQIVRGRGVRRVGVAATGTCLLILGVSVTGVSTAVAVGPTTMRL